MRIIDIFRLAFLRRHHQRRIWLPTIICSIQVVFISAAPLVSLALQPTWKVDYDKGENALAQQELTTAEEYFRKALNLAKNNSPRSEDTEECLRKLAETLALRNKTTEAQTLYQQLLALLVKKYGNSKPIVPVLLALGSIQESLGDHATAITYYQRALHINEKNYGPYSPQFVDNLHTLARANAKAGNRSKADKQYKQAISILMDEPSLKAAEQLKDVTNDYSDLLKGSDDSDRNLLKDFKEDVLNHQSTSANLDQNDKTQSAQLDQYHSATPNSGVIDLSGAAKLRPPINDSDESASAKLRMNLSPQSSPQATLPQQNSQPISTANSESTWQKQIAFEHNSSSQTQLNEDPEVVLRSTTQSWSEKTLSPAYKIVNDSIVNQSRYEQGEEYYKRMIAVDIDALGPNHPSVADDLNGLAQFYIHRQDYAQAEPLLNRAYAIYNQVYGLDNLLTINALASYALVDFHLRKVEAAEELYLTALSHSQSALGPNHFETARILNELAHLYFYEGKLQKAATYYQWALASTEAAVGPTSPLLAACLHDYARVQRSLGRLTEAATLESRANGISVGTK